MTLHLHNTLTRRIEPFAPLAPPRVTLYSCGPTVWNYAHIGNFRNFLFVDLLRRWLEASGFEVYHIMNLTDVDDRIIKEAGARGQTIEELVAPFITAFFEDRDYLRITPAHTYPRATEFVEPMITLVSGLLANDTAYRGEDGSVYFAIDRFPAYGRLSQLDRRELKAGASGRVSSDEYDKENARDFVLWKAARPEDEAAAAAWDAPFGRGRPGWHLECSAMALELIGRRYGTRVLDIHTGGVDLIFPHHEDEIAQSCAFTGESEFARVWMHAEFLNVRGTKMSKRFGNITTPRDLRQDGVDPGALRLLIYQTHYRQRLDLTDEALGAAREGSRRLGEFARRLRSATTASGDGPPFSAAAARLRADFTAAMDDDLNSPRALAALFDFVTEGNRLLDQGEKPGPDALAAWKLADGVLDTTTRSAVQEVTSGGPGGEEPPLDQPPDDPAAREAWALAWARLRVGAKKRRDFAEADRIRNLLAAQGWEVRDRKDGTVEVARR
ncbi:MAG TPA: cysteine--tRNA ligase [Gemmatimonadales bacterium]|nr:cysteine--tRNA ligase [Gemmatimonadales bacterium]